jgi:hypothetical protein
VWATIRDARAGTLADPWSEPPDVFARLRADAAAAAANAEDAEGAAAAESQPDLVELTPERRAQLISFVEANNRMPKEAKARILEQLSQDRVPAQVVSRLESRMGG